MKKINYFILSLLIGIFAFNVSAKTNSYNINIETDKYSTDGKNYTEITTYDDLDTFKEDYNNNKLPDVYITNFLFDGVSSVKSPDLDDFIEEGTNETKVKTLEIKVLNIISTGTYTLTGTYKGMMVAVNTNDQKGNINIILNGVNIDTDSKKAPALFIYNKETTYTDAIVTVKTVKGTKNYLEGGKLKKVSLLGKDELDNYTSNYSGDNLINYEKYTNYYGIYTKSEINNILFATVKADSEDLSEGDPLYFYKGSGAISSDIDLYFEGEGYLEVNSKNKEGIEAKGNLTFSGGTGDYAIYAYDDCLNTTTAKSAGTNVRNTIIIDVNSLVTVVNDEGDEGDAIDSNGSLTINGGTIYAFAHSESQDAGLDSEDGIIINGGKIIATGNMADSISSESKQEYIYLQFNEKIEAGTLIVVKDENDNIITAFETDKAISTLLYSADDIDYKSLKVYTGGTITGNEENGLYTSVDNYTGGEEISYTLVKGMDMNNISNKDNFIRNMLLVESGLLVIFIIYLIIDSKKKKN